ncbi:MAG: aminoglycoside phosphotransferase family protein [Terracidiphilus sp.]|jgi:hypothetical protein
MANVAEAGRFYTASNRRKESHLALSVKGRVCYTVPSDASAREACWKTFRPGRLELPLRAMARLPWLFGAVRSEEGEILHSIREALGTEAGLSCCRTGAAGVWSKDTILFLDQTAKPLYIVKAGAGEAVDALLRNEAEWLQRLRGQAALSNHIPELIAHRAGTDLCFVAQSALPGDLDFTLGEPQFEFLRKLQDDSLQTMRYEDTKLCRNLDFRLKELCGLLPEDWAVRLDQAMRCISEVFEKSPPSFTAAHNDFTTWNIRVEGGVARVFDWEYADLEQLPLFDPLHFALMPMILKREPAAKIIRKMHQTLQLCEHWLGKERCQAAETQALAYFVNLCTLYLWSVLGVPESHPLLDSYSGFIDYLCRNQ